MSMAQKTWPVEDEIRMEPIHGSNYAPLSGKVALVTGGNRGIGKAIALRLASLGADLAICGRDVSTLRASAEELRSSGVRVHPQRADVTSAADVASLIQQSEAALGPVSILVNNAGM